MVVAGVSTFVGALNATSVSGGTISGTTGTFSSTVSVNAGNLDINDSIRHVGDDNTKIRFPAADTFSVETAGSTRLHIHSDGRFRVGCTAQPSGTVGGFQLDMGSYPGTMRLMSGAGASGTQTAGFSIGGSNHNASIEHGANSGAQVNLYNYNSTDGNSSAVSFLNSNGLSIARVLGLNVSHSSRTGALVFMVSSGSHPTEKVRIASDGDLTLTGADNVEIKMKCGTSSGNNILAFLNSGGTTRGNITYDSDNNFLLFNVNQGERLRIDSSGNLKLQGGKIYGEDNASNSLHLQSTSGNNNHSRIEIGTIQSSDNGGIHFYTAGSSVATRRLTIKGTTGNVGINHDDPGTQLIVRAPGGSGHASSQVHSGDSSTIMNMMVVQGSEGRFGMNTNHDLAIYANGLEKARLSKTGSLFIKSLDSVPVNQAESGHYASTGYNAGHALGLMVKRSICVSDADTKGVGGIFLSHTRNVACNGTTYNMMTLHNREGTFVGDVYVGFAAGGSGVVRHYKFTCLYAANTLTSVDYHSRLNTDTISVNISTSNDAHFFQVIPNHANNETHRVSMTIVGAACGRNDGAGGDYYTVNYN